MWQDTNAIMAVAHIVLPMRKRLLGQAGEWLAVFIVFLSGYRLLAVNFRARAGEIDIICRRCGVIVFMEVKTRWQSDLSSCYSAVGMKKRQRILTTSQYFLSKYPQYLECTQRFDILIIRIMDLRIHWVKNAFSSPIIGLD
ncbi:MAG: YraN family protein [Legionellales bacterium]|nr:YraN family protein [Legionellales bacterium]